MTPPPDPVAALAEAMQRADGPSVPPDDDGMPIEWYLPMARNALMHLPAGWSLVRDSERRSAVIGSERSDNEALVAAIPDDPFIIYFNGPSHYLCYRCRGKRPDHADGCLWIKARAAIEGRP